MFRVCCPAKRKGGELRMCVFVCVCVGGGRGGGGGGGACLILSSYMRKGGE